MENINKIWISTGFVLMGIMLIGFVSAGEGGGAVPITSISLTEQGNDYNMKPGRLTFEFNEKLYAVQVRRINQDSVDFLIMTLDMNRLEDITAYTLDDSFSLKPGEKREINLDKDNISDLSISLNEITLTGEYNSVKFSDFFIKLINIKKPEVVTDENITANMETTNSSEITNVVQEPIVISQDSEEQPTFLDKIINFFKGLFGIK